MSLAGAKAKHLRLRLSAAAEKMVRCGHPWVFEPSIREQNRPGNLGELAIVYDRSDRFLALGLYDPESPIRLRILHSGKPVPLDQNWWTTRLEQALQRRRGLFDDRTTGYRWIHGESDGWPGLVLDRYGPTLVLKLYTAAWLPRMEEILDLLRTHLRPERVVLRLSRNIQTTARDRFQRLDGQLLCGQPLNKPVIFFETGLRFEADVLRGQKTGFFLDQRENRRRAEALARGGEVLNAFSFSGGFSLYAARGGARSVLDLDISAHALAAAERNFVLNRAQPSIASCHHQLCRADAFDWLSQNQERKFDFIILDPPALAQRQSQRATALRAYKALAASAIGHLRPGGLLLACSCSAQVPAEEFFAVVRQAADSSRRKWKELETTSHPPDHPVTFKEANYLKAIYLSVHQPKGRARSPLRDGRRV